VTDNGVNREVRESAIFALSQRPRDEGVPILIDVAKNNHDPELRRKAMFWLGQSGDPRALELFESILTRHDK
jgi:HEAT repeat protein